jgi:ferritin
MKDCVTAQFLLQFIEIQRKAVGEVKDILSLLNIAKDNSAALLEIDEKLGK